jgi:hypothetical protein
LCGFLAKVIRKQILNNTTIVARFDYVLFDPDSPETEVTMRLWTRRDGSDRLPSYMSGEIRVGNITGSLGIDVKDDEC